MEYTIFKSHFPQTISKSLARFVSETVFKESRYLFVKTTLGIQTAYCTHCNRQHYPSEKVKHKQKERVKCPHCRSLCHVRGAGISRKYMADNAVLVWYERSVINPKAIVARVISVYRDYSGNFKQVETKYNCSHMYLFEPGNSTYYRSETDKSAKVYSAFDKHFSGYGTWPRFMSTNNIKRAVKGTPFQYSTWEQYTRYENKAYVSDMVDFFDLAARYPCIEYLTKAGFKKMIWAKLCKESTYGAINWKGTTLLKVLRLNKAELNEARKLGREIKPKQLRYYQVARKKGLSLSWEHACLLSDIHCGFSQQYYKIALTLAPEPVVIKYLLKQLKTKHYHSVYNVLSDWRDYRRQCEQLNMSLKEERYLFPNDLHEAHSKLTKRIKLKEDHVLNEKIQARLLKLNKFRYEHGGLLIRPAASSIELFEEGKALLHCVGGYAASYAKGDTDIFLIRKADQLDKPFYTMEVRGNRVVQCRGWDNDEMTPEVRQFVEKFIATKLLTKKRKRVDTTSIRQEAAVI